MFGAAWPAKYETLLAARYQPRASHWAGYCHQWAAGSLDRELARLADSTGGIVCKDISFTLPELHELITAFYIEHGDTLGFMRVADEIQTQIRNETGIDPLPASEFHRRMHLSLSQDQGVVLNIGLKGQVWNYPIYSATSNYRRVSIQEYDGPILDPAVFTETPLLAEYRRVYTALKNEALATDDAVRMAPAQALRFLSQAKTLFQQLKPNFYPGLEILETETQATHAGVSSFASGDEKSATANFSYVMVVRTEGRGVVTGTWRTPIARETLLGSFFNGNGRPGTMWFPKPLASLQALDMSAPVARGSVSPKQELAIRALVNMLQACRPVAGAR
jgi:hypothetical protein